MATHLLKGHALFQEQYFERHDYLRELAVKGQKPQALYIGCADSRVVPEYLLNAGFGELFVLRNVANLVPREEHADASVGAAVEYAVAHLKVPDLIVCGHYGCGGIKAALDGLGALGDARELRSWLEGALPAAAAARQAGLSGDAAWRFAVEENVLDSLEHLVSYQVVRRALDQGALRINGWVYDLERGRVSVYDASCGEFVDGVSLQQQLHQHR